MNGAFSIAEKLAALARWRTVSGPQADLTQFEGFLAELDELFPTLSATAHWERVNGLGVLIRVEGQDPSPSPVTHLMAHYDVVPIAGQRWTRAPFGGEIAAGRVWGRGTLDDKGRLVTILEAAERLLHDGFRPRHPVYISLGCDEETSGDTARATAALLAERDITFSLVLDEGSGIVTDEFRGITNPVALVSIGERGGTVIRIRATDAGGHASTPSRNGAVQRLIVALARLHSRPAPWRLSQPTRAMLAALATHARGPYRTLYRWGGRSASFAAVALRTTDRERAALLRTTEAATVLRASEAANVLPTVADAIIDQRVLPGVTIADAAKSLRRRVGRKDVLIESFGGIESPPVSSITGPGFSRVSAAIQAVHADAVVVPGLMVGITDARFFSTLSDQVFRFTPFRWGSRDRATLHAADESVSVEALEEASAFYKEILRGA